MSLLLSHCFICQLQINMESVDRFHTVRSLRTSRAVIKHSSWHFGRFLTTLMTYCKLISLLWPSQQHSALISSPTLISLIHTEDHVFPIFVRFYKAFIWNLCVLLIQMLCTISACVSLAAPGKQIPFDLASLLDFWAFLIMAFSFKAKHLLWICLGCLKGGRKLTTACWILPTGRAITLKKARGLMSPQKLLYCTISTSAGGTWYLYIVRKKDEKFERIAEDLPRQKIWAYLGGDWFSFKLENIYMLVHTLKPGLDQRCIKSIMITTVLCKEIYVRGYELFLSPSRCKLLRQIDWFPVKTLLFCTHCLLWYDPAFYLHFCTQCLYYLQITEPTTGKMLSLVPVPNRKHFHRAASGGMNLERGHIWTLSWATEAEQQLQCKGLLPVSPFMHHNETRLMYVQGY